MVVTAEQHEVVESSLAAIGPMLDVMRVDEARARAARETAALVAAPQCSVQRRRHDASLPADREWLGGRGFDDRDDRCAAGKTPDGLLRDDRAVIDGGWIIRIDSASSAQRFRGNVHDDLVAV